MGHVTCRYTRARHIRTMLYHLLALCSTAGGSSIPRLMALSPGTGSAGTVAPSNHYSAPPLFKLPSFVTGVVSVDEEGMLTSSPANLANKEAYLTEVPPPPAAASTSKLVPMKVGVLTACGHTAGAPRHDMAVLTLQWYTLLPACPALL